MELKRLEFVRSYSTAAAETANGLASRAISMTPEPLVSMATSAYGRVAPAVEPLAQKAIGIAAPRASAVLQNVDGKVDAAFSAAEAFVTANKEMAAGHVNTLVMLMESGSSKFQESSATALKFFDGWLKFVKTKLPEMIPGSTSELLSSANSLLTQAKEMVANSGKYSREEVLRIFSQLQHTLMSLSESNRFVSIKKGASSILNQAESYHDMIVVDPNYSKLLDFVGKTMASVQETQVGTFVTGRASPLAESLMKTKYAEAVAPYATAVIDYWKPAPALEGIKTK